MRQKYQQNSVNDASYFAIYDTFSEEKYFKERKEFFSQTVKVG